MIIPPEDDDNELFYDLDLKKELLSLLVRLINSKDESIVKDISEACSKYYNILEYIVSLVKNIV